MSVRQKRACRAAPSKTAGLGLTESLTGVGQNLKLTVSFAGAAVIGLVSPTGGSPRNDGGAANRQTAETTAAKEINTYTVQRGFQSPSSFTATTAAAVLSGAYAKPARRTETGLAGSRAVCGVACGYGLSHSTMQSTFRGLTP